MGAPGVIADWSPATLEEFVRAEMDRRGHINVGSRLAGVENDLLTGVLTLATPGARKAAFGSQAVTFPGGAPSVTVNVAHGLGVVPFVTFAMAQQVFEVPCVIEAVSLSNTSSTAVFQLETRDGSSPANGVSKSFYWLAVG